MHKYPLWKSFVHLILFYLIRKFMMILTLVFWIATNRILKNPWWVKTWGLCYNFDFWTIIGKNIHLCFRRVKDWKVKFAPVARDIHWHNLRDEIWWYDIKVILSDLVMLIICLFLTTPEYIIAHIETIRNAINPGDAIQTSSVWRNLPSLLMTVIVLIIPSIVTLSVRQLGYWYRSQENFQVMRRAFW